jgi:hypothetical protein
VRANQKPQTKHVQVPIDARLWRGLQFEADLLARVFGAQVTPEGIVQTVVEESLKSRLPGEDR